MATSGSRKISASFLIVLLLSGEVHAARVNLKQTLDFDAEQEVDHELASAGGVWGNPEKAGWLEYLGVYRFMSQERREYLRSTVSDEFLERILTFSVCIRLGPAGGYWLSGYKDSTHMDLKCTKPHSLLGSRETADLLYKLAEMFVPDSTSTEQSWLSGEFANWEAKHKQFPLELLIEKNSSSGETWPPYTPKVTNRFMFCLGGVSGDTASLAEDCTGFWSQAKMVNLLSSFVDTFPEDSKSRSKVIDKLRAKVLFGSDRDPLEEVVMAIQKESVSDALPFLVPLVAKALDKEKVTLPVKDAIDLGIDFHIDGFTASSNIKANNKPLELSMDHELVNGSIVPGRLDCFAPKSGIVGACEVICKDHAPACAGFNLDKSTRACCFFVDEESSEVESENSDRYTLSDPPAYHMPPAYDSDEADGEGSSLVQATIFSKISPEVAVCVGAPPATAAGGVMIAGVLVPGPCLIIGGFLVAVFSYKALSRYISKKKLQSKLAKFSKLLSPQYSVVVLKQ